MNLNRFDLNLLVALNALLEERHVTRAAERVFLSQPAMSAALQRLREAFNDQLLVRSGRRMELTPKAKSLIVPIREILAEIQNTIESEPKFDPATARRSFTIAMSDYVCSTLMRTIMQRHTESSPGIKFKVIQNDAKGHQELEAGTVDLIIRADMDSLESGLLTENLRSQQLIEDPWVCVVADDHPTVKDQITLEDYLRLPHASLYFGEGTTTVESISMLQMSLDVDVRIMAPAFANLLVVLPGTTLVTLLPSKMADLLTRYVPARILEPPFDIPPLKEIVVWHKRGDKDPAQVWLRSLFSDAAESL